MLESGGPTPSVITQNTMDMPPHEPPMQCQEDHTPRDITWDAEIAQIPLPKMSYTMPNSACPAPSSSTLNAMVASYAVTYHEMQNSGRPSDIT